MKKENALPFRSVCDYRHLNYLSDFQSCQHKLNAQIWGILMGFPCLDNCLKRTETLNAYNKQSKMRNYSPLQLAMMIFLLASLKAAVHDVLTTKTKSNCQSIQDKNRAKLC